MSSPDFIGLGVEKAGTSWIFACLYEHPEVCIPVKEINFFSEAVHWEKGLHSYQDFFKNRCPSSTIKGEFSTSYFYNQKVPKRIHDYFPKIKLLVCLRDPIDRAYSNYLNDIKAGTIAASLPFDEALKIKTYYLDQGKYKQQFERYYSFFAPSQFKVLLYEDLLQNPLQFIQDIYDFIGVDRTFIPPSLHQRINTGRVPSNVEVEKLSNRIAALLQKSKAGEKIWWLIKQSGLPQLIRTFNTRTKALPSKMPLDIRTKLIPFFREDKHYVEQLLNRKLHWFD